MKALCDFARVTRALLKISLLSRRNVLLLTFIAVPIILMSAKPMMIPENISGTLAEGVYILFEGDVPYDPASGLDFKIPILWVLINAFIAFLLRTYPIEVSRLLEYRLMLGTSNKIKWWLARSVCMVAMVTVLYAILYAAAFGYTALSRHSLALHPDRETLHILLAPYLTTIAFCSLQALMNLRLNPIVSFAAVFGMQTASVYYFSPAAIGNLSILIRSDFILNGGITLATVAAVSAMISAACPSAGCAIIRKTDLI